MIDLELNRDKVVTGVGSRKTPEWALQILERLGFQVARYQALGVTGDAIGADLAFYSGIRRGLETLGLDPVGAAEVWIPNESPSRNGYRGERYEHQKGNMNHVWAPQRCAAKTTAARMIAADIHQAWERMDTFSKQLHTRNIFQCLGRDLERPSDIVVLYAPGTRHILDGGTNTAYQCAREHGIPVFNLFWEDERELVFEWLEALETGEV